MRLDVKFSVSKQIFNAKFGGTENRFNVSFGKVHVVTATPDLERYEGDYNITPETTEQTLPTANKYLTEDLIVKGIPRDYGKITYNQNKSIIVS